jgi:hypothetical protein
VRRRRPRNCTLDARGASGAHSLARGKVATQWYRRWTHSRKAAAKRHRASRRKAPPCPGWSPTRLGALSPGRPSRRPARFVSLPPVPPRFRRGQ